MDEMLNSGITEMAIESWLAGPVQESPAYADVRRRNEDIEPCESVFTFTFFRCQSDRPRDFESFVFELNCAGYMLNTG